MKLIHLVIQLIQFLLLLTSSVFQITFEYFLLLFLQKYFKGIAVSCVLFLALYRSNLHL